MVNNIKKSVWVGSRGAFLFKESVLIMLIDAQDWHSWTLVCVVLTVGDGH